MGYKPDKYDEHVFNDVYSKILPEISNHCKSTKNFNLQSIERIIYKHLIPYYSEETIAELLGVCERTVRNKKVKYKRENSEIYERAYC